MKKTSLTLLLVLVQIGLFSAMLIETGKKDKYCFSKPLELNDTVQLSYIVSGEHDEKINVALLDHDLQVIFERMNSDSGDFKQVINKPGMYKLCFFPQNANSFYITFEFFSLFEKGHTLDMAKDENLHEMKKDVNDITLMFEEMEKNVKFIMDRRNKHADIINQIGDSIRHISYLKILVVILVSLLQIFLIHKFFGGSKKTYSNYPSVFEMGGTSL